MRNALAKFLPWRRLIGVSVVLPLIGVLVVLAFAWPAARIGPRDLPVGVVGVSPATQQAVAALTGAEPGGFSIRRYAREAPARSAIERRDIYGAFVISRGRITVLEASAASPAVAELVSAAGRQLASQAAAPAAATAQSRPAIQVKTVDVVPTSASDPRGLVLGAYLIVQDFLGALPGEHAATWASLSLTLLAVSAPAAGLIALLGPAGLAVGAALMIVAGNAFSAATSAPQFLPAAAAHIGQWLPAGAGGNLLRSTAYFHGNGSLGHLSVLIIWSVLGLAAILAGQRRPAAGTQPRKGGLDERHGVHGWSAGCCPAGGSDRQQGHRL